MAWFEPGARVAGYEILGLIAAGGHAEVYEVRDASGVVRALKVIKVSDRARGERLAARLLQEGRILGTLEHPNIVRLYDAGTEGDLVWLLLERVRGCNLTEALRAQREVPRLEAAVRWIKLACEGVAAAHKSGIVHRDLKPGNILVGPQDTVRVIDFGCAKVSEVSIKTTPEDDVGTVLYMSPEQIQKVEADPRMDVYAMGVTLYEAAAGTHPCTALRNVPSVVMWQVNGTPRPLREVVPDAPADLEAVIARAMDKDPARRFENARAMADALDEVLSRMLAPKRRLARNLPASLDRPLAHAVTAPMPAVDADAPPPLPPAVLRGAGATVPMQAAAFAAVAPPVGWAPPRDSPTPGAHAPAPAPAPAPPPPAMPLPAAPAAAMAAPASFGTVVPLAPPASRGSFHSADAAVSVPVPPVRRGRGGLVAALALGVLGALAAAGWAVYTWILPDAATQPPARGAASAPAPARRPAPR